VEGNEPAHLYRELRPDVNDYDENSEIHKVVWNTGHTWLGAYPVVVSLTPLAKLAAGQKVELKQGDLLHAVDGEVIW
jgi:hypothetical protein